MAECKSSARVWRMNKDFDGVPKPSDFTLVEEEMPTALQAGEVLLQALYISVDPYMRIVEASSSAAFPVGSVVVANVGWRTRTVVHTERRGTFGPVVRLLPDLGDLSPSLGLGCVGMTGLAAYFGLLHRGQPQAGHTVLVNAAAGAVGSVVGQLAKIKGCTVIGSAGSQQKCQWLTELGFDHVFNYKERSVDDALREVAPDGIDLYFDNVGGDFTYTVIANHMKCQGRVVICGAISTYNRPDPRVRDWTLFVVEKQLTLLGSSVAMFVPLYQEALHQLLHWVRQGELKYEETITEGFENMPEAFISLLRGVSTGKAIVKI